MALHPVSWEEPTILERRFRPGLAPEEAVTIAFDLLHEDFAYLFEAFWDLWILTEDGKQWALQPVQVKFLVHGLEFDEGMHHEAGHIQVDFGLDTPFLHEGVALTADAETKVRANVQNWLSSRPEWKRTPAPARVSYGRNRKKTSRRN